jgi:hypothetical protein
MKKLIQYIDIIVQSALVVFAAAILVYPNVSERLSIILICQLYLGIWQMTACVISIWFSKNVIRRLKLIHLFAAVFYLTSLQMLHENLDDQVFTLYLTVPPWALAIYYLGITALPVLRRNPSGNFLKHISF